jgi:2-polyprenyl-3-methyl-5-hydroxy-6-metoxy-1,4-benzoquinol methylase
MADPVVHHRGSHSVTEKAILARVTGDLSRPLRILDLGCGGGIRPGRGGATLAGRL